MGTISRKFVKYARFVSQYYHPSGPRLAYVGGVYGSRNLGDEVLRSAAAKLFPRCSLVDYPRKPYLAKFAKSMLPVRNGLLAGGTLISQKEEWLALVRNYIPPIHRFIVFGTGVAHPLFFQDRRREWCKLLEQCAFVGVRGPLSAELLSEVGFSNVEVVGDPVLVYASDTMEDCAAYEPDRIGINIGWDRQMKQFGTESEICEQVTTLAKLARSAGWKVRWFIVCPADLGITLEAAAKSDTSEEIMQCYTNASEYIAEVKSCAVFVGMRLHSVVLATCAYVPSLMLEYRPKCRDYMLSIAQEHNLLRTDILHSEEMWSRASWLGSNRENLSKSLYENIKQLRERQQRRAAELEEVMLSE
jgi:polysaccharide pyruvyl transferase WcaK-like protein